MEEADGNLQRNKKHKEMYFEHIKHIIYIAVTLLLTLFASCDKFYSVVVENNADFPVYALSPMQFDAGDIPMYPDTALNNEIKLKSSFGKNQLGGIYDGMSKWDSFYSYYNIDTVSVFILNADSVDIYSLRSFINQSSVIQRYDLSLFDLESLTSNKYSATISFPPTEAMKHIKMWPPYGTYDENGNVRQ